MKIWQIPEDGLKESLTEPIVDLVYHQRRVGIIEWHPTASNVLASSGKWVGYLINSPRPHPESSFHSGLSPSTVAQVLMTPLLLIYTGEIPHQLD